MYFFLFVSNPMSLIGFGQTVMYTHFDDAIVVIITPMTPVFIFLANCVHAKA